jgi:proteasome lid subunit RPN8/RPN11
MMRTGPVRLPQAVLRALVEHARRESPRECCGFLIGRGRVVRVALALENVDARPLTRYRIDPRAHIEVRRVLRRMTPSLEIVGVYHSHPRGPSWPSRTDQALAHYPEWLHVIVDLSRPRAGVRAFRIGPGEVRGVRLAGAAARARR